MFELQWQNPSQSEIKEVVMELTSRQRGIFDFIRSFIKEGVGIAKGKGEIENYNLKQTVLNATLSFQ